MHALLVACLSPAPDGNARTLTLPPAERRLSLFSCEFAGTPDGKLVAVAAGSSVSVWEVATGRPAARLHLPAADGTTHMAFSDDGRSLVCATRAEAVVRWFDLRTGKQSRERAVPGWRKAGVLTDVLTFGPGGGWYLAHHPDESGRVLRVIDTATGKPGVNIGGEWAGSVWVQPQGVAPGGKVVARGDNFNDPLQVWDIAAGKRLFTLPFQPERAGFTRPVVGASADGKLVAVSEGSAYVSGARTDAQQVTVWGLDDGRRRCVLKCPGYVNSAAFAADGRTVAVGGNGNFALLDLVTGGVRPELTFPSREGFKVYSPDGRTLAVVDAPAQNGDGLLHLTTFPTVPDPLPAAGDLVGNQLAEWRAALGSDNEFRRRYAVNAFVARPDQAAYLAGEQVRPDPAGRRAIVVDLLGVLDADGYEAREKAQAELLPVAHRFEPLLAAAHLAAAPGERRNRLTTLVNAVRDTLPPADLLTDLSAVEVLEAVGTTETKALLVKLADGADGSRLTLAARAAVERLGKR